MPWPLIFGRQVLDISHHDLQLIGFRRGALLQLFNAALEGGTHAALQALKKRKSELR
jgi:hypothetical protein